MVSMNDIIDVFDNCMIALNVIAKCLSCLMGDEATPMIQYRTIRFGSICTKFHEISLFN